MIRLLRQSDGQPVTLDTDTPLGVGGEARIYAVRSDTRLVAKVYHNPTDLIARKLRVMLANPPEDEGKGKREKGKGERGSPTPNTEIESPTAYSLLPTPCLLAWPADLLLASDSLRKVVGFLMPRVADRRPLFTFYNPGTRRQEGPLANYRYLHRTGRNLAAAVRALHNAGCVIGDISETNILVSETALVTLIDCDSFQVRDPKTGTLFRCPVGRSEFTPPELLGTTFHETDRTPEQDNFGLAVLLFHLLMEGTHPFAGIFTGRGDPPAYDARIQAGHFVYGSRRVPYRPMPAAPPVEILHPTLRALFLRAFEEGHENPAARPDANTWLTALETAETALVTCPANEQHRYGDHLPSCPWCERTKQLGGRDPFPSLQEVRAGRHLPPAPRRQTPPTPDHRPPITQYPTSVSPYPTPNAQRPTPTAPDPPQNVWPLAAWAVLGVAFFPSLRIAVLGALILGVLGLREARCIQGIGRLASLSATVGSGLLLLTTLLFAILPKHPGTVQTFGGFEGMVRAVAVAPDDKTIAVGTLRPANMSNGRAGLFFLDPASEGVETLATFRADVNAVAYSRDGSRLAVGYMEPLGEGHLQMWEPRTGRRLWEQVAHRDSLQAVAFSPAGDIVASGGFFDYLREKRIIAEVNLWDVETGQLRHSLRAAGEVNSLAFGPDGRTLLAGTGSGASGRSSEPGRITLWDVGAGKPLWTQTAHGSTVLSVAYSPKGDMVASAGNDNAVRLWDARTGRPLCSLEGGGFWIAAIAFSPDGQVVAGGGNDAVIRLWNTQSGQLTRSLRGHRGVVQSLSFSPKGDALISGSRDGSVKLWRLDTAMR